MPWDELDETDRSGSYPPELQGNILRGIHFPHARFLFVAFPSPGDGRAWLQRLKVSDAESWDPRPEIAMTVAFTHRGLRALGVREEILGEFSEAFRAGMRQRSAQTRDGADRTLWDPVFVDGSIHALVSLYGSDKEHPEVLDDEVTRICNLPGVTRLDVQPAALLPDDKEHFGFRDGISQPIQHDQATEKWVSDVPIGEFLIFPSRWNDGKSSEKDPGLRLGRLGTYLVYRKLEQRVEEFHRFSRKWPLPPDLVEAKMIGRWPNGKPVTEDYIPPERRQTPDDENGFDFSDDPKGLRCPIGAHISRVNPRNRIRANEHRILRRGMPYSEVVGRKDPRRQKEADERGLVFIAMNASIENQFEFLQGKWINEPNFNTLDGVDPIVSTTDGKLGNFRFYHGGSSRPLEQFIRLRGGEYFFVPSIPALEQLAKGEFSST